MDYSACVASCKTEPGISVVRALLPTAWARVKSELICIFTETSLTSAGELYSCEHACTMS